MIRLKSVTLLAFALAASLPAHALQTIAARDGETVFARISQKEVTRIAFERGRIRKVTGNTGEFVVEKDEDRGQVFIRPASAESTKPINVFVTSERATVGLLLQPVDAPSDSIVIRETHPPVPGSQTGARTSRHVRMIKNVVLAMANDAIADDMEVRELAQAIALWPGFQLTLVRTHVGQDLVGEKYVLANVSSSDVEVSARDLFKSGVIAISLEAERLRSGESTNLFVIRERRPHD